MVLCFISEFICLPQLQTKLLHMLNNHCFFCLCILVSVLIITVLYVYCPYVGYFFNLHAFEHV